MGVKVRCNNLSLLLFYTYFLAAWVSNLFCPWFFCQRFPFTDVTEFYFTSAVSPWSILSMVRRNHKEKWNLEKIPFREEPFSLCMDEAVSALFLAFLLSPKLSNRKHNNNSKGHISSEVWEWRLHVLNAQWLVRAGRKHAVPLYSHQHSIYYVHITRWQ